eukprot:Hpha_TRINITY_DN30106_c0_g1::TRINITY_DN30106_c0_g1_i1::g.110700::m.110700
MPAPDKFTVVFETDVPGGEAIRVAVETSNCPLGAERLYELVGDGFFDDSAFFRVVPGFVCQFGIAGDSCVMAGYGEEENIRDEDKRVLSNTKGTLVYAANGKHTRCTQLFFNLADNSEKLDEQNFTPVGTIVNLEDALDTLTQLKNPTPDDKGGVDQAEYEAGGNEWLRQEYPEVSMLTRAYIK